MVTQDRPLHPDPSNKNDAVVDVKSTSYENLPGRSERRPSTRPSDESGIEVPLEVLALDETSQQSYLPSHERKRLRSNSTAKQSRLLTYLQNSRLRSTINWLAGPKPAQRCTIQPLFPKVQSWLSTTAAKKLPGGIYASVAVILVVWLAVFSAILATSTQSTDQTIHLSCISRLWYKEPYCGLNGEYCQPFEGADFTFSCPSNCAKVQVLEPYMIGDQEIIYRSLVIGGPSGDNSTEANYRGDSFICPAAIHAGLIKNEHGGCARLHRLGQQRHFTSSVRNGISSIAFIPEFPLSYTFSSADVSCGGDPQWKVFSLSIVATTLIALITPNPGLFVSSVFVIIFFQIALASDAPYSPSFNSVLSVAFSRFLPAVFVALVIYQLVLRRTLHSLKAFVEKTVLWLGGCWVGALNSYTFDRIPLRRLTDHDLKQQPGAITVLIVIVLVILAAAVGQVWYFRREGRLLRMLGFYLVVGVVLGCLAAIPFFDLRIHHYVLALLLLPGTSLQTRPSLLYQGLLFGLFINGVARWGFASILETAAALRGDGQSGSSLPRVLSPVIDSMMANFTLPQIPSGFGGISVLVNDVERVWQANTSSQTSFVWNRTESEDPVFFRFAFTQALALGGKLYGDYTKPGTWYVNGSWSGIPSGPSK